MNENIFQQLFKKAKRPLAKGVPPKNVRVLWQQFSILLKHTLQDIYDQDSNYSDQMARRQGNVLINKITSVAPTKRLEAVKKELASYELYKLDAIARELGMNWLSAEYLSVHEQLELQQKAAETKQKLEDLYNSLAQEESELIEVLKWEFSESLYDCEFVLGESNGSMSLRTGRLYEDRERAQKLFDTGQFIDLRVNK